MSPELERLLEALYEKLTCPPEEKSHRVATFERLLQDALARRPGTSRNELLNALPGPLSGFPSRPTQAANHAASGVNRLRSYQMPERLRKRDGVSLCERISPGYWPVPEHFPGPHLLIDGRD